MKYKCAECGQTFYGDRSDEDAREEAKDLFGWDPIEGGMEVVCDTCWRAMGFGEPENDPPSMPHNGAPDAWGE